jgi:hypothetical protein
MTLDGDEQVLMRAGQLFGVDSVGVHGKVGNRALDGEAMGANGVDVRMIYIAQCDFVAGRRHVGTEHAADSSGPDDCHLHCVISISCGSFVIVVVLIRVTAHAESSPWATCQPRCAQGLTGDGLAHIDVVDCPRRRLAHLSMAHQGIASLVICVYLGCVDPSRGLQFMKGK